MRPTSYGQASHRTKLVRRRRNMLGVPIQYRADHLPSLAGKAHHLYLLDRKEIRRSRLYANAWNQSVDLKVEIGHHLHDVLAGEVIAAALQHFHECGRCVEGD